MSRFYVGQRVRIKWSLGWPELAGQEGTIKDKGFLVQLWGAGRVSHAGT